MAGQVAPEAYDILMKHFDYDARAPLDVWELASEPRLGATIHDICSRAKTSIPIASDMLVNGDLYPTDVVKIRTMKPDFDASVMTHTGHYPMLERPDEFNRQVRTVVEALEDPSLGNGLRLERVARAHHGTVSISAS